MKDYREATLYIGEDLLWKLPEAEQEKFSTFNRYKPDWVAEVEQEVQDKTQPNYKYAETWEDHDELFKDLSDYEDFWGDDQSQTGGSVYSKDLGIFPITHQEKLTKNLAQFLEGVKGSQIRIKYLWEESKRRQGRHYPAAKVKDCLIVGEEIFNTLKGKDGKAHFTGIALYAHSPKGLPSFPKPTLLDDWDGDEYFFDKKELGEFFGAGEDLEGLDAKYNASPCSRIKARTFASKRLTDEEKKMWMERSKDFAGNQVKIIEVWS